jgi:hypothetical protein
MTEIPYYQDLNLGKKFGYGKLISTLDLKMEIDELDGEIWDPFFVYNLIKNIEIEITGCTYFRTNGLIIKSKIDMFYPKFKNESYGYIHKKADLEKYSGEGGTFTIPLFITNTLYTNTNPVLKIEINELYPVKLFVRYKTIPQLSDITYPIKKIIKDNQSKILNIEKNNMTVKRKIMFHGVVDYIIFVCDPNITIDKIDFNIHGITQTYPYYVLNQLQPHYYLNKILPKNYCLITFNLHGQIGLNFSKLEECEATFNFRTNNGGNIYIIAESNNIEYFDGWGYAMYYSYVPNYEKLENSILRSENNDGFIRIVI